MNTARYIDRCSAAVVSRRGKDADFSLVFSVSRIHTTRGAIASFGRLPRCGSCSTERSSSKKGSAQFARVASQITTKLCPTTSSPRGWEARGETTTPTMFRQFIGGAIYKKGRKDCLFSKVFNQGGSPAQSSWKKQNGLLAFSQNHA